MEKMVLMPSMKNLFAFVLPLSLLAGLLLFHSHSHSYRDLLFLMTLQPSPSPSPLASSCAGRYIFVHKLPDRFNVGLLRQCRNLSVWTDMCYYVSNSGIGHPLPHSDTTLIPTTAWYAASLYIPPTQTLTHVLQHKHFTKFNLISLPLGFG